MTRVATLAAPATFESDDSIRLLLKPDGDGSGHVDGAWWPHSRDLTQDLPVLLDAVAPRLGAAKRVIYRIQEWEAAPKGADVVVTMGCGDTCPYFPGKRYENWDLADPAGQPIEAVRPIRDDIEQRVRKLLVELNITG
ncbi:DUF5994 family protein [Mycobacterium sp. D16R24]|uniref:DUF5994 family protein n=1 Tax=Mycobacterium sp. D16R24 TaxID=1855656 RepID=UPI00256FD1E5|nr:DUF5994 family protein [Mycobacterium sp. D16R24]